MWWKDIRCLEIEGGYSGTMVLNLVRRVINGGNTYFGMIYGWKVDNYKVGLVNCLGWCVKFITMVDMFRLGWEFGGDG